MHCFEIPHCHKITWFRRDGELQLPVTLNYVSNMKPRTWVELPSSRYGIEYVWMKGIDDGDSSSLTSRQILPLNSKDIIKHYFRRTGHKLWKRNSRVSPFETKLHELDHVTRRDGYGDGTAVMYIREIFEPGDLEYDYVGDYVCAAELSQEQVDRLRIMILPRRREELLLSYLDFYKATNQQDYIFNESTDVIRHFEGFHRRYLGLSGDLAAEKFNLLFCFTFAIKTYSGWIIKFESNKKRTTMIATLAKLWRKLLGNYTPAELGTIDQSCSFAGLKELTQHGTITLFTKCF